MLNIGITLLCWLVPFVNFTKGTLADALSFLVQILWITGNSFTLCFVNRKVREVIIEWISVDKIRNFITNEKL